MVKRLWRFIFHVMLGQDFPDAVGDGLAEQVTIFLGEQPVDMPTLLRRGDEPVAVGMRGAPTSRASLPALQKLDVVRCPVIRPMCSPPGRRYAS